MSGTRFYTKAKTAAFSITGIEGATKVSLDVVDGTCTIEGDFSFDGDPSGPVQLTAGKTCLLIASSPNSPISGVTITPSGGTTNVVMSF